MTTIQFAAALLALPLTAIALVKVVIPGVRWVRKLFRRLGAAIDSIGGRDPIVSRTTGKVIEEAIPPLGQRLDNIETQLNAVIDVHARLDNHEGRIRELEVAREERVVASAERTATAAASAEMLRLVRDRELLDVESTEDDDPKSL